MEKGEVYYMSLFLRLLAKIYFDRIEVKGTIPSKPAFYVSNHRNGAVDGLVIYSIFQHKLKTVIGKNLTNNAFMRLFFRGQLEIYRYPENMAQMRHNRKELKRINSEIENGTSVLLFPEGTSHLGKGLLEIRKGVAHIVTSLNERKIVPIGLHYEKGWSFRSRVFVHVGEPVEIVGESIPEIVDEVRSYMERVYDDDYEFEKPKKNGLVAIALFPIILLFFIANLLAMLIPYLIAKKFADDNNVITLWRILSGVPTFILQTIIYIVVAFWCPWILVAYMLISFLGLFSYRAWKDAAGID